MFVLAHNTQVIFDAMATPQPAPTTPTTEPLKRIPTTVPAKPDPPPSISKEKRNWLIHLLYVRKDYDECLKTIDEQLKENKHCEYPLYIKGMQ